MALAILRLAGGDDGRVQLDAEIGSNRYWRWAIGSGEVRREGGVARLDDPAFTSELLGPAPDAALGRVRIEIPAGRIDREHRHVQLMSYRTTEGDGPAISEILRLPLGAGLRGGMPEISFSLAGAPVRTETTTVAIARAAPRMTPGWIESMNSHTDPRPIPFTLSVRREAELSDAMFLPALLPILAQVAPAVGGLLAQAAPAIGGILSSAAPAIGSLLGGLTSGGGARPASGGGGNGGAAGGSASPNTQEILRIVQAVLQGMQQQGGQPASPGATPAAQPAAHALSASPYSTASMAPLAALMPLLQQVLTPETVQALITQLSPRQVIGAVTDSVTQIGRLGADIHRAEMEHLERLNPGVNDPALDQLMAGMSLARSARVRASGEPDYRRVPSVTLDFTGVRAHTLEGRPRVCYRAGGALGFPLAVDTPRQIREARLHLVVKDVVTREVIARARLPIASVAAGALSDVPSIAAADAAKLKPGEEYLVTAHLVWRDRQGRAIGACRSQLVTIVGDYLFGRVGEAGPLVALNDVDRHRDYWHKVWQGTYGDAVRSVDFDCKYHYTLDPSRNTNARQETVVRAEQDDARRRSRGRIQSGMVLSPVALNALLPQLGNAPALDEAELAALRTSAFSDRFAQAARFKVAMRGRNGTSAAIWVFPELRVTDVVLHRPSGSDEHGQVERFAEHVVKFPMPALVHYIGARTAQ